MSKVKREGGRVPGQIAVVTGGFLVIYTLIHVLLNLTDNGSAALGWPHDFGLFLREVSGPITIGLSTSLLILSFAMFLHHGGRHVPLSSPNAFVSAFIIFSWAIILVQISGHAEIYVNACHKDKCAVPWLLSAISCLSYLISWLGLLWLETFNRRIYGKLKHQIPEARSIQLVQGSMVAVTCVSLAITALKILFILTVKKREEIVISIFVLILEIVLVGIVVFLYFFKPQDLDTVAGSGGDDVD